MLLLLLSLALPGCSAGPSDTSPDRFASIDAAAEIAATPCTTDGEGVWVDEQGWWACETACTCVPGSTLEPTCILATGGDGGVSCWARVGDYPGAGDVPAWWVAGGGGGGDDFASCQDESDPCNTLEEVWQRVGAQPLTNGLVTVTLSGSFPGSHVLESPDGPGYFYLVGSPTPAGPTWAVTATVPWGALGTITLGPYSDADAGTDAGTGEDFVPSSWPASNGFALLDLDQEGLLVQMGPATGEATIATAGGVVPLSYTPGWPALGDRLQAVTLTGISTNAENGDVLTIGGQGLAAAYVTAGSGIHAVELAPEGNGIVEFDASIVVGTDVNAGFAYYWGDQTIDGARVYGYLAPTACTQDGVQARGEGYVPIFGPNLFWEVGLSSGTRDGAGGIVTSGPVAVVGYVLPCLAVDEGGLVTLGGPFTCDDAAGAVNAIDVAWGTVSYDACSPPELIGTMPSGAPFVAGTASGSSLPISGAQAAIVAMP